MVSLRIVLYHSFHSCRCNPSGIIDTNLPLLIHEELLERLTIPSCSLLFNFIESRADQLTAGLVPSKGKGLTLLRLCNDVIRRLSKPTRSHTIFAGRVLSLLSAVLPLGERSGVNLRGDFNVDNKTVWEQVAVNDDEVSSKPSPEAQAEQEPTEKDGETAEEEGEKRSSREDTATASSVKAGEDQHKQSDEELLESLNDPRFYSLFWKQQDYFSNPMLLFSEEQQGEESVVVLPKGCVDPAPEGQKGPMRTLRLATRTTLSLFAAVARKERELAGKVEKEEAAKLGGSSAPSTSDLSSAKRGNRGAKRGSKRKASEDNMDVDDNEAIEVKDKGDDDYFPKYLTGRNLLEYEVRDEKFRRHVLVQYLILFQYLLGFTAAQRERAAGWKNQALATSTAFVLDEADDRWLRDTWKEIVQQLKQTHSSSSSSSPAGHRTTTATTTTEEGRLFSDSVLQVLRREQRWLSWKADSCPPIDKAGLTLEQIDRFIGNDTLRATLRVLRPFPHKVGTAALSNLWEDGVKRPEPTKRTMEDAEGNEVQVDVDGLDDLEWPPTIPSLEQYADRIRSLEAKMESRRQDLGFEAPAKIKALGLQIGAEVREAEVKRLKREAEDESLAEWNDQRAGLSWKAMRLARNAHVAQFAKVKVDDVLAIFRKEQEQEAAAAEREKKEGDVAMKSVAEVVAPSEATAATTSSGEAEAAAPAAVTSKAPIEGKESVQEGEKAESSTAEGGEKTDHAAPEAASAEPQSSNDEDTPMQPAAETATTATTTST